MGGNGCLTYRALTGAIFIYVFYVFSYEPRHSYG